MSFTVKHFNQYMDRWVLEQDGQDKSILWVSSKEECEALAEGYRAAGYTAKVVDASDVLYEQMPFNGSLVEF